MARTLVTFASSPCSFLVFHGQGSLKDTSCPFEAWLFQHQRKGKPPFTSCNVQVYSARIPVGGVHVSTHFPAFCLHHARVVVFSPAGRSPFARSWRGLRSDAAGAEEGHGPGGPDGVLTRGGAYALRRWWSKIGQPQNGLNPGKWKHDFPTLAVFLVV